MAIDFKTFNLVVDHVLRDGKPVMIRGRHGIGKSQVVYQTAKRWNLPVVERRASQMTEVTPLVCHRLREMPPSGSLVGSVVRVMSLCSSP